MRIDDKRDVRSTRLLRELNRGDVFDWIDGAGPYARYMIKTEGTNGDLISCVSLDDGSGFNLPPTSKVVPLKARLVIENSEEE